MRFFRPSLVWTISNSSRPTIERSSEHNVTPLAEIKSNWISYPRLSLLYGVGPCPAETSPQIIRKHGISVAVAVAVTVAIT
jgi:hypothetical protein